MEKKEKIKRVLQIYKDLLKIESDVILLKYDVLNDDITKSFLFLAIEDLDNVRSHIDDIISMLREDESIV